MFRKTLSIAVCLVTLATASQALAADKDVAALFSSSFLAESKGDYRNALNRTLEILRQEPTHYIATLRAGWLYYRKGQHEDAIATYRRAMTYAPRAIEPMVGLTLPTMALARWKEAGEICRQILKKAPAERTALSRLAYVLYNAGNYVEALRRYNEVLVFYPGDMDILLGRAWTLLKMGRRDDARRDFTAVLTVLERNVSARAGLDAL